MVARLKDTILGGDKGYAQNVPAPMINLQHGGQMGSQPDIATYISNTPYVRKNIIALLIAAPLGFDDLDNGDLYRATLKALVELHAQSISGLNSQLDLSFEEAPVGGAGEVQHTPSDSKRQTSSPSFVWVDKYGKPISYFFRDWITKLIMDPNTKFPTVVSRGKPPTDLLPDYTGMTCLFFEPDPTHTKVLDAWLCTNMMPRSSGAIEGSRDLNSAGQKNELNIEFTALTQTGYGVMAFAQKLLQEMNLSGLNPNLRDSAVKAIDEDVKKGAAGYVEDLDTAARTRLPG